MLAVGSMVVDAMGKALAVGSREGLHGQKRHQGYGLRLQQSKIVAMSLVCGWRSMEASSSTQAPIQDATAPPTLHPNSYKIAPKSVTFKICRKKRSSGGEVNGDGFDGIGGFYGGGWDDGGGEDGGGGGDFWGENWEEEWWWRHWQSHEVGKALGVLYQAACWMSLTHSFHYTAKRILNTFRGSCGDSSASGDPAAFAHCSSVFLQSDACSISSENLQLSVHRR